ncbi:NTP transferase domain-containing protein [Candidatus Pacearchaeota archaeon]|nr:NTP transferase domain-containing protein [Candidatus Pacearchaeota archaeon]
MKGVILAGGKGLRLYPLTKVTNKHLLPVGKEPMIMNPIRKLKEVGIKEILVISGTEHMGSIVNLLGSGSEYNIDITYKIQDKSLGIAHALSLSENFSNGGKIIVILGDNITTASIKPYVDNFKKQKEGAKVLLKKVEDPNRYGIAAIDEQHVLEIEEKPNEPKSNFAVLGYYMYDSNVFNIIREIEPSDRGEYEITDVNNRYISLGKLTYDFLDGDWTDAGTFNSLLFANQLLLKNQKIQRKVSKKQLYEMINKEQKKINELSKFVENGN